MALNYVILTCIVPYLTEKDKLYCMSTNKTIDGYKNHFKYYAMADYTKIKKLAYYNNFTNVRVSRKIKKFPASLKTLQISKEYSRSSN